MGTFFNPDNDAFRRDVANKIYIDKTGLLKCLNEVINSSKNCIAVSHARRFGKSQAAGMIDAYYSVGSDSHDLFSPFEIFSSPDFEKHLNKYNVIHIDVSSFTDYAGGDVVEPIKTQLIHEFKAELDGDSAYNLPFSLILNEIYRFTGRRFVIIIDEWDCVIRNYADHPKQGHNYLRFLHTLFKSEESRQFLALGYITGILPIKKIKDESALNNFKEYTMLNSRDLTPYYGFTEAEVRGLCDKYSMDFESVKKWYDGYLISGRHMYNPNSVYDAMVFHELDSYWKNTSAFETINKYITMNYAGLKDDILYMLSGGSVTVDTNTFQNDLSLIGSKDQALTALIHLGYLSYDSRRKAAYIPNYEVALSYQAALATGQWTEIAAAISRCEELLWATVDGKEEKVAALVEQAHDAYASVITYNNENALSCVITMAYFTAPAYYTVIREFPSGKGYADYAFLPRKDSPDMPAMIIELKWDKTAESAIDQIKNRNYIGKLTGYTEEILLVGINYDKDTNDKKHRCKIEKVLIG